MEQSTKGLLSPGLRQLKKIHRAAIALMLFMALVVNAQASSYSESVKFDLKMNKVSLKKVFQTITEQSEFKFIYNNDVVNENQKVTLSTKDARVEEILDEILPQHKLDYKVIDRQVIIFPKESEAIVSPAASQQGKTISGTVIDEGGEPLPGVSVVVKGTTIGIVTDVDGNYSLEVPADAQTLVFSFVGMRTREIAIGNRTNIDVTLETEAIGLEEVIAVGYASQKKTNVVGSVTSVSGEQIEAIPAADVSNTLSGRMTGVTGIQETGEPGQSNATILVRGRTTLGDRNDNPELTAPLVVVDGVPGRSLGDIDPVDIESISVLKDASAAIYGSTAANGVILVTTKRGKAGKPRMNYQFYQGFMTPTILPEVTNAGDYATMLSEYQTYENRNRTYSDEDIALFYSGRDPWRHPNSDWIGDLVADWTTTIKHNFSIDGGSNGMFYYVSLGYKNEEAIYEQESTNYKQYNLRAKLELPITDWLTTSVDYAGFMNKRLYPTKSAADIYGQSTRLLPTRWSFWPNGKPGPDIEYGDNPVVTSTFEGGYDDQTDYINQLTFRATITPPMIEGLTLSGYYTYDVTNFYRKQFRKPWILYTENWDTAEYDSEGYIVDMELTPAERGYSSPELAEDYSRSIRKLANVNFNYTRDFGDHSFTLFGAYEQIDQSSNNFGAFRKYYISDVVQTIDAGSDQDKDNWGSMWIYARKSYIGRLNYSYAGKYLLEGIFRRDGSLKFPPDSRWGNFPGLLLGWRASEENFWKDNLAAINYFKLKLSYGKMGMDPGDPFQYMNKYVFGTGLTMGTGKTVETVVQQEGVANPFITWEKQTTYNAGFESQFLDNLFSLDADVFYSKRSDILTSRDASVPGFTGLALPDENIAEVDNRGFEIEAGYHKNITSDLRLDVSGNFSYNHNEVVFMDEPERAEPWQRRTGHPYGAWLMYDAIGVFADEAAVNNYPSWDDAKPGDVIFRDVDGDGAITSDDRILVDKTDAPEVTYGISVDVNYKNWHLSLLAQGQGEYYRMNIADGRRGEAGNYFQWSFDDRWTPDNRNTNVARAYNRDDQYWAFDRNMSTYHLDNMAYFRLKNAVLTYTIPNTIFGNLGISRAQVYFAGNNLFLIYAAQKNFDPEIGAPMTYPAVKTLALGVKVTF